MRRLVGAVLATAGLLVGVPYSVVAPAISGGGWTLFIELFFAIALTPIVVGLLLVGPRSPKDRPTP